MLQKYWGEYYKCERCGFLQIFDHPWLNESYSSAITSLDIGLLRRNIEYGPRVKVLIDHLITREYNKYLDYGGGYGLFVRLMRDRGFDFYRYDMYCENIFANSFDYNVKDSHDGRFDLLTAFEVFEHISNPIEELKLMLDLSENIFFSTELQPKGENIENWSYLLPEIGQHISFYSCSSLQYLAKKFGFNFYTDGKYFHLFTKRKISSLKFNLLTRRKISSLFWFLSINSKSLLETDYKKLIRHNQLR